MSLRMVMTLILATASGLSAHIAAEQPLTFDVAAIKLNRSGSTNTSFRFQPGGRFEGVNITLHSLIRNSYRVQTYQIVEGPEWMRTERFDITARAAEAATPLQVLQMVQSLIADRFKLVIRREPRELPIYALTLSRGDGRLGPKLKPSAVDCQALYNSTNPTPPPAPPNQGNRPVCGIRTSGATMVAGGTPMAQFAMTLSQAVDRPVIDRTGLTGGFDIDLAFTADQVLQRTDNPGPPDGPSLFTALQEQLGLKLEPTKGPVDVLVVVSTSRPTED